MSLHYLVNFKMLNAHVLRTIVINVNEKTPEFISTANIVAKFARFKFS